jgi:hypothetical protein
MGRKSDTSTTGDFLIGLPSIAIRMLEGSETKRLEDTTRLLRRKVQPVEARHQLECLLWRPDLPIDLNSMRAQPLRLLVLHGLLYSLFVDAPGLGFKGDGTTDRVHRVGVGPPWMDCPTHRWLEACRLYPEGWSLARLAERYDVIDMTMRWYLLLGRGHTVATRAALLLARLITEISSRSWGPACMCVA